MNTKKTPDFDAAADFLAGRARVLDRRVFQRLFQGGEGQVVFSQGGMEMIQEIRTCGGGERALGHFALNLLRLADFPGERQRLT